METLDKVRKGLKQADKMELTLSDDFLEQFHDKVMAKIEQTEVKPKPKMYKTRTYLRTHWRGWVKPTASTASMLLMALLVFSQFSALTSGLQRVGLLSRQQEQVVAAAVASPEDFSETLLSNQSESDFFVDVASESFEDLSVAKFNQIMGESRSSR